MKPVVIYEGTPSGTRYLHRVVFSRNGSGEPRFTVESQDLDAMNQPSWSRPNWEADYSEGSEFEQKVFEAAMVSLAERCGLIPPEGAK